MADRAPRARRLRLLLAAAAVLGAALAAAPPPVAAHPHVWIDTRAVLHLDADRRLHAVALRWLFDELYSEAAVMDLPGRDAAALRIMAAEAMTNLRDWRYFTDLRHDGRRLDTLPVTEYDAAWVDGRLEFTFTLTLPQPVDLRHQPLALRVFDPSFYIDVAFEEDGPLAVQPAAAACSVERRPAPAEPDLTVLSDAYQSPDVEPGSEGIGGAFADTLIVHCP